MTVIVGLDLSLTSTGVARIITHPFGADAAVRRVTSKAPPKDKITLAVRSTRLRRLAGEVVSLCADADLVVVEGPSFASSTGSAHDRAGLWWMIVGRLTGGGLNVVETPPTVVKTYATGKGNADKDHVLAAVIRRYPQVEVSGNDEADALILAAMGARFIGEPVEETLPETHLRAMKTIKWNPNERG